MNVADPALLRQSFRYKGDFYGSIGRNAADCRCREDTAALIGTVLSVSQGRKMRIAAQRNVCGGGDIERWRKVQRV